MDRHNEKSEFHRLPPNGIGFKVTWLIDAVNSRPGESSGPNAITGGALRVYRFIVNPRCDTFTMQFLLYSYALSNIGSRLPMSKQFYRFMKDESGTAAVEYGLLTSGISLAIIPAVKEVGSRLVDVFTTLQNAI
jgi:pilus assembly protein Flp/PilA